MARPLSKNSVDLATPVVRVSRIRRDPPPPVKEITAADIREQDERTIVVGIISVAVFLILVLMLLNNFAGWSPGQYSLTYREAPSAAE